MLVKHLLTELHPQPFTAHFSVPSAPLCQSPRAFVVLVFVVCLVGFGFWFLYWGLTCLEHAWLVSSD